MSEMDSAIALLNTATSGDPAPVDTNIPDPSQQVDDNPTDDNADGAVDSPDGEGGDKSGGDPQQKAPTSAQIRQSLKAFRDSNPDHSQAAKILNDSYGRAEAYKQVYPSVDEARAVKTQLDAIGGLDGLAQIQSDHAAFAATDDAIVSGDPEVLDALIKDAPDGFKKLAPHYLSKLQKLDGEAFTRTMQPHFIKALTDASFPQVVSYLERAVADKPEALAVVRDMKQWFEQQKGLADKYSSDATNPNEQKLQEGWKQLETERRQELQSTIDNTVGPHVRQSLGGLLKPYSEALNGMPEASRRLVAGEAIRRLAAALDADKPYRAQIEAMYAQKKPDRNKIIDFNKNKVNSISPKIIESIIKDFALKPNGQKPGPKPGQKRQTQTAAGPKSITQLGQAPRDADIDWTHEHMSQEAYIRGRAVLKNGNYVSWKK